MNSAIERLLSLRVRDIMNSNVVSILESRTMAEAATILDEHGISGAPVVNSSGGCVGVLSTSDFAYRERLLAKTREVDVSLATDCVRDHMSPLVKTVNQEASIVNAGRILCAEHIHRLVIVDNQDRPVGIMSSLDLVAAMIAAVEE